jgi:hypothetical protein
MKLNTLLKLTVLVAALSVTACPHPGPGPGEPGVGSKIVHCGTDAVAKCAPGAMPAVNECLAGTSDITSCLMSLIQPAGCVTYEVIACLTRREGTASRRAADANPDDTVSKRKASRAEEFLSKQGVQFAD